MDHLATADGIDWSQISQNLDAAEQRDAEAPVIKPAPGKTPSQAKAEKLQAQKQAEADKANSKPSGETATDHPIDAKPAGETKPSEGETGKAAGETKPAKGGEAEGAGGEGAKGESQEAKESRFAKEQKRAKTQWDEIAAEKQRLRKEREDWEREKQRQAEEIERARPKEPTKAEYEAAAQKADADAEALEKAGKYDEADERRHTAKLYRKAAAKAPEKAEGQRGEGRGEEGRKSPEFEAARSASWERAKAESPEVFTKGSPLNLAVLQLLNEPNGLFGLPEGPYLAVQLCKARLDAQDVPGLRAKVESMTQENAALSKQLKELQERTSLAGGGGLGVSPGQRRFEDLSLDEQKASIKADLAGVLR